MRHRACCKRNSRTVRLKSAASAPETARAADSDASSHGDHASRGISRPLAEAVVSQSSCGRRRPSSRMTNPPPSSTRPPIGENKIAIHPVQGLAQCHQFGTGQDQQESSTRALQPTNAPTSPVRWPIAEPPRASQRRGLQRGRLRRCGERGIAIRARTTTKVEDARASGEGKGGNDVVQCAGA